VEREGDRGLRVCYPVFQSPRHRGTRWNSRWTSWIAPRSCCFSPLVIGALGGTPGSAWTLAELTLAFQSPRHRGTRWNTGQRVLPRRAVELFQSPRHRGTRWNVLLGPPDGQPSTSFSPLVIGALGGTRDRYVSHDLQQFQFQSPRHRGTRWNERTASTASRSCLEFQSPRHRGTRWNRSGVGPHKVKDALFQSPRHRGTRWNALAGCSAVREGDVSVPSS